MELLHSRKAWGGAGLAAGFALLVAWMVPPTDPKPMGPNWRAHISPAAPPAPVDFSGLPPALAALPAYPVERYAYAGMDDGQDVAIHRGPAIAEETYADRNEPSAPQASREVPADDDGYRWLEHRARFGSGAHFDPRLCTAAPNQAAENACRAYAGPDRDEVAAYQLPDLPGYEDTGDD
jgi:hypothetical protein